MSQPLLLGNGSQVVAAAGTPVPLTPSSTPCARVDIQAKLGNTGVVSVGSNNTHADVSGRSGIVLQAGDVYSIEGATDLSAIFIDASVSAEGVTFTYWVSS